ncbi:hypothetical protein SAMN05216275_104340 [Streptosporangium canum]|uniref:Lipoprotein n=1 Tax=Streptosporangium canum TaxID=324952 RepID=A0A1I3KGK4_9ACTN|nr:hypothetical protein [Streptosporangium canum]SFI71428.1 hypothetical protein SAMN05216275_104340 [Streptosporangium canum]
MRTLVWPLLLVMVLSACSSNNRVSPEEFQGRAREVAGRWHGSEADRTWREGFVPLWGLNVEQRKPMPDWVRVSKHNGVFVLDADLSTDSPSSGRLRRPAGSTMTVPLVTAAAAYAELSKAPDFIEEECPTKGCIPLRVTHAELGEVPVITSWGTVQVPAWHFRVKGVKERFSHVAVHPSAITPRPVPRKNEYEEVLALHPVVTVKASWTPGMSLTAPITTRASPRSVSLM